MSAGKQKLKTKVVKKDVNPQFDQHLTVASQPCALQWPVITEAVRLPVQTNAPQRVPPNPGQSTMRLPVSGSLCSTNMDFSCCQAVYHSNTFSADVLLVNSTTLHNSSSRWLGPALTLCIVVPGRSVAGH